MLLFEGEAHDLGAVFKGQFAHDTAQMGLHGAWTDLQSASYFFVGKTLNHLPEYSLLGGSEDGVHDWHGLVGGKGQFAPTGRNDDVNFCVSQP